MKKDSHVNKLAKQPPNQPSSKQSASNCFPIACHMTDPATSHSPFDNPATTKFLADPGQSSASENHASGSPELCEKIRSSLGHFTDEFKEKFIKKKNRSQNRSPNLFVHRRDRSNNSSDQEEYTLANWGTNREENEAAGRPAGQCSITRIQISASEENGFSRSPALSQKKSFGKSRCSAGHPAEDSQSTNLSQNSQCGSVSQCSLLESARSPFVNRALPPLPKKDDCQFGQAASNSRCGLNCERGQSDERSSFLKSKAFNQQKSNEKSHQSSQFSADSDDDDDQIPTTCFKLNRENKDQLKKCSAKIKNEIRHFLPKKYSHPPPHLHSKKKIVQQLDYDEDEEEEEGDEIGQPAGRSSLINLNSHLIHSTASSSVGSTSNADSLRDSLRDSLKENNQLNDERRKMMDYAESIEKVKDCGWYWGSISGEKAELLLANEPEGSFIVRDSSDENYIFSLTFKLNGDIIHVRIEHNQGNFSFGSFQKFKSKTIVDFIHDAVEYSRSGRYLFFLHRLPVVGPMRVQLLNPVSRFRNVQSLRHLCRFVILKHVRRDLLPNLPLPDRLIKYLNATNYFVESTSFA